MAKIGRPRAEVVITDSERAELRRLTKRAHVNRAVAFRARVVLAVADDTTDKAVARRLRTTTRRRWPSGACGLLPAGWRGCTTSRGSAHRARCPTTRSRP